MKAKKHEHADYLRLTVDLARQAIASGAFPAGAVLVTKAGNVYESEPSTAWYHGECMVVDKATRAEGGPLTGATMYTSIESCLMCTAKMYWAGVANVRYIIPKAKTDTKITYEDDLPILQHSQYFHSQLERVQDETCFKEAFDLYQQWLQIAK